MASKCLLVFTALLAAFLVISSAVAAKELEKETNEKNVKDAGVAEKKYPNDYGGGYGPGYGGGYPNPGGRYPYPEHRDPYPGHGHYPPCRCCHRGYYGGCQCCQHPDEIPDPEYLPEYSP